MSAKYQINHFFDVFDVTNFKHKEMFFEGKNVPLVVFRNSISTGIVCNKYCKFLPKTDKSIASFDRGKSL